MRNPVWAYGGGLLALAGAAVLGGMNVSAALGGDPAFWPTLWRVAGAVLADVAAACLPFAVFAAHRKGELLTAAFLALIWAAGCSYTVYAATEWSIAQAAAVRDPLARAQWLYTTVKGSYEQQVKLATDKLTAANRIALEGRNQTLRNDAMLVAKSAQNELHTLYANPPAVPKELQAGTVNQAFSDWPWFWPVMLLVFSQAGWLVLAVAGASSPPHSGEDSEVRTRRGRVRTEDRGEDGEVRTGRGLVRTAIESKGFQRGLVRTEDPILGDGDEDGDHEVRTMRGQVGTGNVVPMVSPRGRPTCEDIEKLLRMGMSQRAIAAYFSLDPKTIRKIRTAGKIVN
jgi:hypothetical protein